MMLIGIRSEKRKIDADGERIAILGLPGRWSWQETKVSLRRHGRAALDSLGKDWRLGAAASIGAAAIWATIAGMWTPRGPLTSSQAIWSLVLSLVVGAIAGLAWRSRLAMIATPAAFVAVFEAVRAGTDGPTVDGIHFSTYGILALVVGRLFQALVSLLPMALGASMGAAVGRKLDSSVAVPRIGAGRYLRRGVAVVTAAGLVALSVGLARPASTDPILDSSGQEIPGSIAELTTIDVNGHYLSLLIRGHNTDNPVLLFLAGGPGGSEMGAMRNHLPALEQHFTVATWDQRGTGRSYPELDPTDTMTVDGTVDDTLVVTDYLRDRFGQNQIYLSGQSWGSVLGVLTVQQRPTAFRAFIGVGQMVDIRATDTIFYNDTLAWARANGNDGLVGELERIGPPPYDDMLDYETALSSEHEVYPYDHSSNSEGEGGFSENFLVKEYALIDQVHLLGSFMDTFSVLYPQLQGIDFRQSATTFDVPMYFVQGAHEAAGRADVFAQWYPMVDAPTKDLVEFQTSGHRPLFEQPDQFVDYMVNTVLAQTADR